MILDSKIQYYKDFNSLQVDLYLKFNTNPCKIAKDWQVESKFDK